MNVELKEFLETRERGLRQGLSSDAQVFDEHGKRFVVCTVGAVAGGDAQWFRAGR
jgi:hypothetical protein